MVSSIYFALLVDIQAKLAIVLPGPNFNFFLVITAAISFSTNLLSQGYQLGNELHF